MRTRTGINILRDELDGPLLGREIVVLADRRGLAPVDLLHGALLRKSERGAILEPDVDGRSVVALIGTAHSSSSAEGPLARGKDGGDAVGQGDGVRGRGFLGRGLGVVVLERGRGASAEIEDLARELGGGGPAERVGCRVGEGLGRGLSVSLAEGEGLGGCRVVVGVVRVVEDDGLKTLHARVQHLGCLGEDDVVDGDFLDFALQEEEAHIVDAVTAASEGTEHDSGGDVGLESVLTAGIFADVELGALLRADEDAAEILRLAVAPGLDLADAIDGGVPV